MFRNMLQVGPRVGMYGMYETYDIFHINMWLESKLFEDLVLLEKRAE